MTQEEKGVGSNGIRCHLSLSLKYSLVKLFGSVSYGKQGE